MFTNQAQLLFIVCFPSETNYCDLDLIVGSVFENFIRDSKIGMDTWFLLCVPQHNLSSDVQKFLSCLCLSSAAALTARVPSKLVL